MFNNKSGFVAEGGVQYPRVKKTSPVDSSPANTLHKPRMTCEREQQHLADTLEQTTGIMEQIAVNNERIRNATR